LSGATATAEPSVLNILNNLIYEYNKNMREYNQNTKDIIRLLQRQTTRPAPSVAEEPISLFTYTYYPINLSGMTTAQQQQQAQQSPILTREEIAYSTRTYGYTEIMAQNPTQDDVETDRCPISLETFRVGDVVCEILGCGHLFKRPSLMNWFRRNTTCPVCRYELRDYRGPVEDISNATL
jgi:hypothetical protein